MPRSQWLRCPRETGVLLDEKIEETVAAVADQIGARAGINPARARHWRTALGKAQEKWRDFRDYECAQLASSERGVAADGYEAQLLCRLRTGRERLSDRARRYPPSELILAKENYGSAARFGARDGLRSVAAGCSGCKAVQ